MSSEREIFSESLLQDLETPLMNAAGFMGFILPPLWKWLPKMSVFVTNPVSFNPRSPTRHRSVIPFPGGFLLHTGFPNEGFIKTIRKYQQKWSRSSLPIWVHLLADTPSNLNKMIRGVEGLENMAAVELGLPLNADPDEQRKLVTAALGELPLYVNLPVNKIEMDFVNLLPTLGVEGVVLSAPRGSMKCGNWLVSGRLFGPALFPQLVQSVIDLKNVGLTVVAGSGVYSMDQAEIAIKAGARAVQFDGLLWQV
jgi:dihydroorotate dehydrogenase